MKEKIKHLKKKFHLQSFVVGVATVLFFVTTFVVLARFGLVGAGVSMVAKIGNEKAASIMKELVENNLIKKGTGVAVEKVEFMEKLGLYEVKMKLAGKTDIVAFLSKDGKYFVKEATSLDEIRASRGAQEEAAAKEAERKRNIKIPKSEKPEVEVFVMSHCPYGTQVQKGFLPVMKTLGSKAVVDFKFVDYLMHGKKELVENLNQHCIEQTESEKQLAYLECFLGSKGVESDSRSCMKKTGISESKIANCVAKTDKQFMLSEKFENMNAWEGSDYPPFNLHKEENDNYQVGGSPTIVINGTIVEPNRDPRSLLKTVCSAFEEVPAECEAELSSQSPVPGFGVGSSPVSSSDAGCEE